MYVKAKKLEPRRLAGPPVEHVVHDRERSFLDLLVEVSDDCLQKRGGGSATHRPVLNIPGASKNKNREVTRNGTHARVLYLHNILISSSYVLCVAKNNHQKKPNNNKFKTHTSCFILYISK